MKDRFMFKFEGKGVTYFAQRKGGDYIIKWIDQYDYTPKWVDYSIPRVEANIQSGIWVTTEDNTIDKIVAEAFITEHLGLEVKII